MTRRLAALVFAVLAALGVAGFATEAAADRLDLVRKRGALVVGVKTDYPPFGMLDADGAIVGLEPDLAADLARRLGVELRLVGVTAANRLQKLEDGSVDAIIATLGDTAARRALATLVEPNYYASGVTVLLPPDSPVDDWRDLLGLKVCATQGALFNKAMAQRYLLDLQLFNGTRDAKLALRDGRCAGWLYDDTAIAGELRAPEWQGYKTPLPPALSSPWAIAAARGEEGANLAREIGDAVADWHRTGLLVELERRWGMAPSAFTTEANALWTRADAGGEPVCRRLADGGWPAECRNRTLLTPAEAGGLHGLGLLVKERTGLDFSLVYDTYDRGLFLRGVLMSLLLVAACLAGSFAVGILGAFAVEARLPVLGRAVKAFAFVSRSTPPLLQMYVVFFGIGGLAVARWGWTFDGFAVASACLSLYAGSACVFAWTEAAATLRESDPGYRLGPRTLGRALPLAYGALVAALVNIVKATGMASAIAVPEMISASTAIVAEQGNPEVMMNVLMIAYFLLVLAVVRLFTRVERKVFGHGAA